MEGRKKLCLCGLLLVTLLLTGGMGEDDENKDNKSFEEILNDETHPGYVEANWNYTKYSFSETMEAMMKKIMPMVIRSSSSIELSGPCMASLFKMMLAMRKQKLWAVSLVDSWGKPAGGLFSGAFSALGDYDQCVNTVIKDLKDAQGNPQVGQYCLATYAPLLPPKPQLYTLYHKIPDLKNLSIGDTSFALSAQSANWMYLLKVRIGVCMPNSCTAVDIKNILDEVPKQLKVKGNLEVKNCETKQSFKVDNDQLAVLIVCAVVASLLLIGTVLDVVTTLKRGDNPDPLPITTRLPYRFLVCFSLYTNFRKIINTKSTENNPLGAVSGVRFITVTWVIVGHSYLYADYNQMKQALRLQTLPPDFAFQIVANSMLTVDTYILMSGLLVTYAILKAQEKRKGINIPMYIFHRFWRLTPPYMMTIALLIGSPILGSGPVWKLYLDPLIKNCKANWWTNLLYVNNYVNTYDFCLEHTWYLGVDMQLHILALVVLLPLLRWPKFAAFIGTLLVVGCSVFAGLINIIYDLPPSPLGLFPDPEDRIYVEVPNYFKPYGHVGPYFLGVLLGYIIVNKPKLHIPQKWRVIGWLFFTSLSLVVMYGAYPWNTGVPWTPTISALYGGTSKFCWALGIFWMLLVCTTGNGGIVNDILCWKAWVPLSRISFVIYLVHPLVIWVHEAFAHDRMYTSHYFWLYNIMGHFMMSTAVALVVSLSFEAPFLALEKILFAPSKPRGNREKSQRHQNGKVPDLPSYDSEMKSRTYSKSHDTNSIYRNGSDGLYRVAKENGNGHRNGSLENGNHYRNGSLESGNHYRSGSLENGNAPRNGGVENGGFCRL